jgi:cytochrome c-type biogenesis protein
MSQDLNINLLVSFAAGLFSFLTPCVLPLVPAYVSLIGGLTFQDIQNANYSKSSLVARSLLFILGFTVVFVLEGLFLWGAFHLAGPLTTALTVAAGCIIMLLGLDILFDFLSFLRRERRFSLARKPVTSLGVFAAGLAMGAGWSPCIGPLLGGIIALAASGTSLWGIANLAAYSLGLGLPFIALALAFVPISAYLEKAKKHFKILRIASGILLIFIGLLILLGQLTGISAAAARAGFYLEEAYRLQPWAWHIGFGIFYFSLGAFPLVLWLVQRLVRKDHLSVRFPFIRIVFLIIMTTLAILELTGVLPTALLLSTWFSAGELSPLSPR